MSSAGSSGWVAWLCAALWMAACGQTSSHAPNDDDDGASAGDASSKGGAAATAGASHTSGAPPVTLGGRPSVSDDPEPNPAEAGAPSLEPHPAAPCEEPMPLPYGGGYESCADGSLRRSQAAKCVSQLPRSEPATGRVYEECELDADCTERDHGYCAIGACYYGCVSDSECASGELCFCGELIGQCQVAACLSDADCPADYPCTGNPGSGVPDFRCQTPFDECQVDGECNQLDARMHCESDGMRRACVRSFVE